MVCDGWTLQPPPLHWFFITTHLFVTRRYLRLFGYHLLVDMTYCRRFGARCRRMLFTTGLRGPLRRHWCVPNAFSVARYCTATRAGYSNLTFPPFSGSRLTRLLYSRRFLQRDAAAGTPVVTPPAVPAIGYAHAHGCIPVCYRCLTLPGFCGIGSNAAVYGRSPPYMQFITYAPKRAGNIRLDVPRRSSDRWRV